RSVAAPREDTFRIPDDIPSPPVDFIGRAEEIKRAKKWLIPEEKSALGDKYLRCINYHGRPGVGKTSLAFAVVQQLCENEKFPKVSTVLIDLCGSSSNSLSRESALKKAIQAFKP